MKAGVSLKLFCFSYGRDARRGDWHTLAAAVPEY